MKSEALTSYRISCIRERRVIENLNNEKARLENLVTQFKNNNKEYNKIKQAAEEKVNDVLTNGKLILKFATFSVIESLRNNPELYNFMLYNNSNNIATFSYGSNYPPLMLSGRQQQQQQQSFNDTYSSLILQEAEKLYNQIITELMNRVIAAAASIGASSLPSLDNMQKLTHKKNNTYQIEELRYNANQPEIYDNDKEQPDE
jgi:hypothetical protein